MKMILPFSMVVGLCFSTGCTGPSPLECANDLVSTEFGFALTVPPSFECASAFSTSTSLATLTYRDAAASRSASVQVNDSQNGDIQGGVETEDLGDITNDQGFKFQRRKVTLEGIGVSYVGGTTLSGGNNLFITVSGEETDTAALDVLNDIIATVGLAAS